MKLSELGEFGLIDLLNRDLICNPAGVIKGVGDDAAVLKSAGGAWLLFTTDMMVEGVHFSLAYSTFRQVGWKALAVNLSDIAAMGGRPAHALVSLAVPPRLEPGDLVELYEGLREAARTYGVNIVGGDTVGHPERLVVSVALLGEVEAGRAVYRSGARPGDRVYVTGTLGAPAAGLHLFQNPHLPCSREAADFCRRAHAAPRPRVWEGRFLARRGISAMDDISDGLASEMHEICGASGVGCLIRPEQVPIDPRVREVAARAGVDPLQWALYGGEDLELVFTAEPGVGENIRQEAAGEELALYQVGVITAAGGVCLERPGGEVLPLPRGGYDHFRK
ncbi:MAG: thiamine-phosphate kinase [Peptococcaceae bacterium]|nr:thiamine-phosphate kinase [Peptococcaceae bacterium]